MRELFDYLDNDEGATAKEIAKRFKFGNQEAIDYLDRLVKKGSLRRRGTVTIRYCYDEHFLCQNCRTSWPAVVRKQGMQMCTRCYNAGLRAKRKAQRSKATSFKRGEDVDHTWAAESCQAMLCRRLARND